MQALCAETFLKKFGEAPKASGFSSGRLEFVGNHVDYNGGEVLGAAVTLGTYSCASARDDGRVVLESLTPPARVEVPFAGFERQSGEDSWANYILGVVDSLRRHGYEIPSGFSMTIAGDIPQGAGMSSSAALELSSLKTLCALFGFAPDKKQMALIGKMAENEFVGMPCGILDQGVSAFGWPHSLVWIDCLKLEFKTLPLPDTARFFLIKSGVKHALVDSQYAARHAECARAFDVLKARYPELQCLAHATIEQVRALEAQMGAVPFRRAMHVVEENARVKATVAALASGDLDETGRLMNASHASSRDLFENSVPELDFLADGLQKLPHVYGARMMGGGWGGAVMAFVDDAFESASAEPLRAAYAAKYGNLPETIEVQ